MDMGALFEPFERLDGAMAALFDGAPLAFSLGLAVLLGLRHALDPDHLVAVTSLVAERDGDVREGARIGAWWGIGHAAALLAFGLPAILVGAFLPGWLQSGAERLVGVVVVVLAVRVLWKWIRGEYRADAHGHAPRTRHRHLRTGDHEHPGHRTPTQAVAVGVLHGLAGSGAVIVLLIAGIPSTGEALLALTLFAPMSVISMALTTGAFSWLFTRKAVAPVFRGVLVPSLGCFGVVFGFWYAGLT